MAPPPAAAAEAVSVADEEEEDGRGKEAEDCQPSIDRTSPTTLLFSLFSPPPFLPHLKVFSVDIHLLWMRTITFYPWLSKVDSNRNAFASKKTATLHALTHLIDGKTKPLSKTKIRLLSAPPPRPAATSCSRSRRSRRPAGRPRRSSSPTLLAKVRRR